MFTREEKQRLKEDGMSFEEIQNFEKRLQSHKDGTAVYVDHDTFWKNVYRKINNKMAKQNV